MYNTKDIFKILVFSIYPLDPAHLHCFHHRLGGTPGLGLGLRTITTTASSALMKPQM